MGLEKLVKGATKIKMAPPKPKYVEPILQQSGSRHAMQEVIRLLGQRIQGSHEWTIVFKALVVLHLLVQHSGAGNVDDDYRGGDQGHDGSAVLDHMARNMDFFNGTRKILSSSKWSRDDVKVIERYNQYLKIRCKEYDLCGGVDYVKVGFNIAMKYRRARNPQQHQLDSSKPVSIATEMDHVESLQNTISALIKNRFSQMDLQNDLILYAFRLLVADLLPLYNSLNEGVIALLESFFELSRPEAKRTLELYKTFVDLTDYVVKYLKTGKAVGLKIPVIKHITTKLISSLEDHIKSEETGRNQRVASRAQSGAQRSASHNATEAGLQRNDDDDDNTRSTAQQKLEQIREQKKQLEQQLQNQQVLITPTVVQDQFTNNPFTQNEAFTFEAAGNPFAMTSPQQQPLQQQPIQQQPIQQPLQQQPLQQQQPHLQQQQQQMMGYNQGVPQQIMRTSTNPFSVENMAHYEQNQMQNQVPNPFGGHAMPTIQEDQQPVTYAMIPVQITNPFVQQQPQ